jgi:CheY-like chemotaxis protein
MNILVVDDDADVRRVMQRLLQDHGHTVCMAWSGEGAIRMLETEPIDLVLLDLQLVRGGLDGWDVARRKQVDPRTAKIPFIVISGTNQSDALSHGSFNPLEGALIFIGKPVDNKVLLKAIETLKGSGL